MIKTETQERKLNEDLFFQYLIGIKRNAEKAEADAWKKYSNSDLCDSFAYLKFARANERTYVIDQVIKAYCNQVRGGLTI